MEQTLGERNKLSIFWGVLLGIICPCISIFLSAGPFIVLCLIGLGIYAVYFINNSDDQTLEKIFPASFNVDYKNISYYDEKIDKTERKIKNLIAKKEAIKSNFFSKEGQ